MDFCALVKLEKEALTSVSLLHWQMEVHVGQTHTVLFGVSFSVDAKVEGQVACNEKKVDERLEVRPSAACRNKRRGSLGQESQTCCWMIIWQLRWR